MFCPNCGANNHREQTYCRFCRLNLQDTAKSLTNQLVFGEDSNRLKTLSSVKRIVDYASTVLIGALVIGILDYLLFQQNFGKDWLKISLGVFFLLKIMQEVIAYYQRQVRGKLVSKVEQDVGGQLGARETTKLLEEKPFERLPSVVDNSTELLPAEIKARQVE